MMCRFEVPSGSRDLLFQRSQEGLHFEYNGGMKVSCQPPCSMSSDHASLCHILSIGVGLVACVMHLVMSPPGANAAEPLRYDAGFADGSRLRAARLTSWSPPLASVKLDDRELLGQTPPVRWIYDRRAKLAARAAAWIETWTGDLLPCLVLRYSDGQETPGPTQPAHLVARSVTPTRPPQQQPNAQVRIRVSCVRRIVWQDEPRDYEPGTVVTRDGRRVAFRALRWSPDAVTLLTDEGRRTLGFADLAELNLPAASPWPALVNELALLSPDLTGQLMQLETSQGVVVTTSWQRQRVATPRAAELADAWLHGVHPAWSLDVLWLPANETLVRRLFPPTEIPLSRIRPERIVQRSPWLSRDDHGGGTAMSKAVGWRAGRACSDGALACMRTMSCIFLCQALPRPSVVSSDSTPWPGRPDVFRPACC